METAEKNIHEGLVKQAQLNDRQAQTKLYQFYAKAMLNTAFRIIRDRDTAEDIMHDAFIDAFKKLDQFQFESSFGTWLKRIVINKSLNHVKRLQMILEKEVEIRNQSQEEEEASWEAECSMEEVHRAMESLAENHRLVFTLYMLEGYDHEEIGEILQITSSTSRSQLSRAKTRLREIIIANKN